MNPKNADPPYETSEIGTPLDYTEDLYRFYFEIRDTHGVVERALNRFLGSDHAKRLHRLTHGFEMDLPIFRASKINNLLISLKQGFFGTVGDSYVDSVC